MKFITNLTNKLIQHLRTKEGFTIESLTQDESCAVVRDVFGFRYEIQVKILGRTQDYRANIEKLDFLDVTEISKG